MSGRTARLWIAPVCLLAVLVATTAGAATTATSTTSTTTTAVPNGNAILAEALAWASHQTSMTISGTLSGPGTTWSVLGKYTSRASWGLSTVRGVGASVEVQPNKAKYGYVKANSIAALRRQLEVSSPKSSEVGVWFKVTSNDPRFADLFGGASTIAQAFSFSSLGWIRSGIYEGTEVLNGVQVIVLVAASHMFDPTGYNEESLYVTDTTHPQPFAMTGPIGTTGLIYFSKWNSTTLAIPKAKIALPY